MTNTLLNVVLATSLGTASVVVVGSLKSSDTATAQETRPNIAAAIDRGGLKEAARVSGGHYMLLKDFNPHLNYDTLRLVAQAADAVVIADAFENQCHLSKDGRYITTSYKAYVRDVLSGNLAESGEIVFSVVGGKVDFGDGLSASVETPGFRRPENGERLLVFLTRVAGDDPHVAQAVFDYANGSSLFRLAENGRGVYGLPLNESDKVNVKSKTRDGLARETKNKDVKRFLQDVRQAIKDAEKEKADKKAHEAQR